MDKQKLIIIVVIVLAVILTVAFFKPNALSNVSDKIRGTVPTKEVPDNKTKAKVEQESATDQNDEEYVSEGNNSNINCKDPDSYLSGETSDSGYKLHTDEFMIKCGKKGKLGPPGK